MAGNPSEGGDSGALLLKEIEALSNSLYQQHTSRRRSSYAQPSPPQQKFPTPATAAAAIRPSTEEPLRRGRSSMSNITLPQKEEPAVRSKTRRLSMSPWKSRPKADDDADQPRQTSPEPGYKLDEIPVVAGEVAGKKGGIWNWKPIRTLTHIGMHKLSVLFSLEVIAVQNIPATMNGLRLAVTVRKHETKEGAVQTMPARVMQGSADFEETLFVRCHLYYSSGKNNQGSSRFEPRPFVISVVAVDAEELDFGRNSVDLSYLVQESMENNSQGVRVRQWDAGFRLSGKAKGAELVIKLGFQIMEKDSGIFKIDRSGESSARRQSKFSFSVPSSSMGSPRLTAIVGSPSPSLRNQTMPSEFPKIEHLSLDDPSQLTPPSEVEENQADDVPDFDIIDKGVEIQKPSTEPQQEVEFLEEATENEGSVSSEVVKEVVEDRNVYNERLAELDAIAEQIKALESLLGDNHDKSGDEVPWQDLDDEEENVTREFLQLLEDEGEDKTKNTNLDLNLKLERREEEEEKIEGRCFLPDLGKGLGSVIQTRDGGFLTAANPLNKQISRKDSPIMAIQVSKPIILPETHGLSGFDIIQKISALGQEELVTGRAFSSIQVDDLYRKTAEQIAFEGIASAVISGRSKEAGASSSAAKSIAAVKKITSALNSGRKDRPATGIWNPNKEPITIDDLLPSAMQILESMAVDALKIQSDMSNEDPPFKVSSSAINAGKPDRIRNLLSKALPIDDDIAWTENQSDSHVYLLSMIQFRDPCRQFEAVGGPLIFIVQGSVVEGGGAIDELRLKVVSVHVSGLKLSGKKRSFWDGERQRLTAAQWLLAHGLGKTKQQLSQGGKGGGKLGGEEVIMWSISAKVVAELWLKPTRNPDVKFSK